MIRQNRDRNKLASYYETFSKEKRIDPNVHPWIAASWQESEAAGIKINRFSEAPGLNEVELATLQAHHRTAIEYMQDFSNEIKDFLQEYDLCLLLLDSSCTVLKNFSSPYNRLLPRRIEGKILSTENVGTFSASIAAKYKSIFWMFGPEIWLKEYHDCDSGAAPIYMNSKMSYIVTILTRDYEKLPQDAVISLLMSIKTAMEIHLKQKIFLQAQKAILDAAPFAVYHIMPNGDVAYANRLGMNRLSSIGALHENAEKLPNLNEVVFNYKHTPIYNGFKGVPCTNHEVTWATSINTYEDITTVVPIRDEADDTVNSVVTVTMPIEDLRMLVAHAAGYTAKYSLDTIVGTSSACTAMKERAMRAAKKDNHILLQGESGTGKQRLAHGIHMASSRAAGPLIYLNCNDLTPELLEQDLFGLKTSEDLSHTGKLELASGGTLLLDEVEKMPFQVVEKLAKALKERKICRIGEDLERNINVRIIAAADGNLRRLCEKGLFAPEIFEIISKNIIHLPSLRSRREDIPILITSILNDLSEQHKMKKRSLSEAAIRILTEYDWPGNIKQLQSVIENAFFSTQNDVIEASDINLIGNIKPDNKWKEDRDIFIRAWQSAGGNVSRLANLLGVSRVTLYRYMHKYGIEK